MKLYFIAGIILFAGAVQQGEASATRQVVEELLTVVNTAGGQLSNGLNDYFLEKLKNETEIQQWSVDIQVKVVAGVANLAFNAFNAFGNASHIDVKLFDCIVEQESDLLATLSKAASDNGWCNNRLAANLTRALQGVSELMVERNVEFKKYLDSLSTCILGDDICFTQYVDKVVAYVQSEFGDGDTMLSAVQKVIGIYKIMFGEDVPACNDKYLFPEIADGIHATAQGIFECMAS